MESKSFWSNGFLNAHVGEDSQNAVEFTILFSRLGIVSSTPSLIWLLNASRSEEARHGKFRLGHDNLTAVYSQVKVEGELMIQLRKELNLWYRLDSQYYHIQEGDDGLWRYLLLSIAMIYGALIPWKFRRINGQWQRFKKTDGLLLSWLRFKGGIHMPITKKCVNFFIWLYFGSWKEVFKTYFVEDHPLLKFPESKYEL